MSDDRPIRRTRMSKERQAEFDAVFDGFIVNEDLVRELDQARLRKEMQRLLSLSHAFALPAKEVRDE